ncbi:unnamed protein product [Citrullus colocynthis]|uniref:Protein kinase domain-containing protein n=1 Tax=Citrullus colocynthis TaxID=252529 RepID=A0ABP0Z5M5_9ROSI
MGEIAETHGSYWVRDHVIGADTFGLVFLAKNNSNPELPSEIPVKSFSVSFSQPLQFEKELPCNLGGGWCSHVLRKCYGDEITITKSGGKVSEVRRYTRDIVHGLCYLHCNARYIHCNISSSSILLSPIGIHGALMAKIANLGSAKKLTSQVSGCDFRGSEIYMSPELTKDGYLDWPANVWALGCVVSEMLTGSRFLLDTRLRWDYVCEQPKVPDELSRAGKDFLRRCFVTSPYKRTPTWLLIKHPFVPF